MRPARLASAGPGFSRNAAQRVGLEAPRRPRRPRRAGRGSRTRSTGASAGCPGSPAATRSPKAPVARPSAAARRHAAEHALAIGVDPVVGRQHDHHVVVVAVDGQGRQRDRRRRVAALRLRRRPDVAQLAPHEGRVAPAVTTLIARSSRSSSPPRSRRTVRWSSVSSPVRGRNGFGRAAGQGPEAGPTAAGHDHDVHRVILGAARRGGTARAPLAREIRTPARTPSCEVRTRQPEPALTRGSRVRTIRARHGALRSPGAEDHRLTTPATPDTTPSYHEHLSDAVVPAAHPETLRHPAGVHADHDATPTSTSST